MNIELQKTEDIQTYDIEIDKGVFIDGRITNRTEEGDFCFIADAETYDSQLLRALADAIDKLNITNKRDL